MPFSAFGFETREVGVVSVELLNMRLGAGIRHPVVKVLKKNDQVKVLSYEKGWLQVLHEGDVGYISDRHDLVKIYTIQSISNGKQSDLDVETARAKKINQKISNQKEEVSEYTRQEKKIINKLNKIELDLNITRKKAAALKSELKTAYQQIAEIEKKVDKSRKTIDKTSRYAVDRLVTLYKLNRLGETNLLASATSLQDLLKRKAALERVLKYDHGVIEKLVLEKSHLASQLEELNQQKNKKSELRNELQYTVIKLSKDKKRREELLAEVKKKKTNRLATIKYLKKASIELDKTINALRKGEEYANKNISDFSAYQGLLKLPVNGRIISEYGNYIEPASGANNFRSGIEIQSKQGTPIRAVFSGQTIYSSWLKGYGNVIIISHGGSFHTVYAHAEELFRQKGEQVKTGEVIATVGNSGSMSGPSLYFEIRHKGNPVDPLEWVNKS